MNFNNVSVLSYSQSNRTFDGDITFSVEKNIQINGLLLDLNNTSGVENIISQQEALLKSSKNTPQEIIINSQNYGDGYVIDFSIDGDQIQTAEYSATIIIVENKTLSEILIPGGGNTLDLSQGNEGLVNEDLKFLESLTEDLDFQFDISNGITMTHSFSCIFGKRESIIAQDNSSWSNSVESTEKIINIKNKGHGAIKIASGANTTSTLSAQTEVGEDYVLEFEYLGQDDIESNWGQANVNINGSNQKNLTTSGFKFINFTANSTSSEIRLVGATTNDTYFDNVKLYKKTETPIEKSRSLANVFLDSSPIYGIINNQYQGDYQISNVISNLETSESFSSINNSYSQNRVINYNNKDSENEYDSKRNYSIVLDQSGGITINEISNIKLLKNKNDNNLKNLISSDINSSYQRCLNIYSNYLSYYDYGCSETPSTPLNTGNLFSKTNESKEIDFRSGSAVLNVSFSNSLSLEDLSYTHNQNSSISYSSGIYNINVSGAIGGNGDSISEKYTNAKTGFNSTIESDLINKVNEIKLSIQNVDFYLQSKQLNLDEFSGSVSYSYIYTTDTGYEKSSQDVIKNYTINTSTQEFSPILNEYVINCTNLAQYLGDLHYPKTISINISATGYYGQSFINIYDKTLDILNEKQLLLGETSKNETITGSIDQFITNESVSFDKINNSITYSRDVVDISVCPVPTVTRTPGFGAGVFTQKVYITPTPYDDVNYQYIPPTPTNIEQGIDYVPYTPT